ncbi:MAG TPA: copper-binding protein [Burkholderiaceae bacterium]|jgi:Cu(I)/Ag(I) efflux system periplasmic protein CusF|nr:copper-binding protein [Burkholderiaceae bacterium]
MKTQFAGLAAAALVVAVSLPLTVRAQSPAAPAAAGAAASAAGQSASADGEIRRLDKDSGRVTIRHGEIKELDMPPMTMVFHVRDKAMLDPFKPGDKVRFKVVNEGGKMVVTDLQPA